MITLPTLFIAASAAPMISFVEKNRIDFTTESQVISIGEYHYNPIASTLLKAESVELIDADDFLDNLATKYELESHLPAAREWLADELYGHTAPTLAALRLKKGLTQNELAVKVSQPQSSISRLESGTESPSIDRAAEIARALEVSLDTFHAALQATREEKSSHE